MLPSRRFRLGLLALLAPVATPAPGQVTATYEGTLTRRDSTPVARAEVRLERLGWTVVTDRAGRFSFPEVPSGTHQVLIQAVGLRTVMFEVVLLPGEIYRSRIILEEGVQRLAEVTVKAPPPDANARRLQAFARRRQRGLGVFLTREDLDRREPRVLSDALVSINGTRVLDRGSGRVLMSSRGLVPYRMAGGLAAGPCILRVVVDGVPMPPGHTVDHVPPSEILAVEVYAGAASMPVEFAHWQEDSWCGLVVIWTRAG